MKRGYFSYVRSFCIVFDVCLLGLLVLPPTALAQTGSKVYSTRPTDKWSQDGVEAFTFAPDGRALAFVRKLGKNLRRQRDQSLFASDLQGGNIWVQDAPGSSPRKITDGETDASGWGVPAWSPDGKLLAFLSSRGGSHTLWVWERSTGKMRQASKQGVLRGTRASSGGNAYFTWLDATRVIYTTPVEGETVRAESRFGESVNEPVEAWERLRRGERTASVLSSTEFRYDPVSVYVLDVSSGNGRRIGITQETGFFPNFIVSPDKRYIAFVRNTPSRYNSASRILMGYPHEFEIRTIEGKPTKLAKPLPENIHTQNIHWSPDGKDLAFFANGPDSVNPTLLYGPAAAEVMPASEKVNTSMENPAKLYRLSIEKGVVEQVPTGEIDLGQLGSPDFIWTADNELVFLAPKRRYGLPGGPPPSRGAPWGFTTSNATPTSPLPPKQWWLLSRTGESRPLAAGFAKKLPTDFTAWGGGLLGISEGDLWRFDPRSGGAENLTDTFDPAVLGFSSMGERLLLTTGEPAAPVYHLFDESAKSAKIIASPVASNSDFWSNPQLQALDPASGCAIFVKRDLDRDLSIVAWRTSIESKPEEIVRIAGIDGKFAMGERREVEYTSLNGKKYKADLVLPIGYKPGQRVPLYVPVRMGARIRATFRSDFDFWAAAGYAVLIPSIPSNIPGMENHETGAEEGDSLIMAANGVVPAVEKVVEMGVADTDRVFIHGSSRGGWTALAVISTTTRFRAAVAMVPGETGSIFSGAGGGLDRDFKSRYTDQAADFVSPAGWYARGYNPSDIPWWREGRDQRNNPLNYVDRVQTPVMLITGDLDSRYQMSEDYFNALVSMRKPAEIVRYWGEDHGPNTSANIEDRYRREVAWFDRWGDIARDEKGNITYDGKKVKGRNGAPPLKPDDYAKFEPFQPLKLR